MTDTIIDTKVSRKCEPEITELFEAFLKGGISSEDELRLIDFIRNNPALGRWMERRLAQQSDVIDPERSAAMLRNIHNTIDAARKRNRPRRKLILKRAAQIAAVGILPLAATLITLRVTDIHDMRLTDAARPVTMTVEKGQKAKITLPDGSRVWLNSNTEISYGADFNRKERNVTLSGEAYFEVTGNASRPFSVSVPDMRIRVIGTEFNVKAYGDDRYVSATLLSGEIEAVTSDGTFYQNPNQRLVFDRLLRKAQPIARVEATDHIGWINNTLRFVNEPLGEIVKMVERMYNIDIRFEDDKLRDYRFTGTLPNTSLESILEVISITSPVAYRYDGNHITFSEDTGRLDLFR